MPDHLTQSKKNSHNTLFKCVSIFINVKRYVNWGKDQKPLKLMINENSLQCKLCFYNLLKKYLSDTCSNDDRQEDWVA